MLREKITDTTIDLLLDGVKQKLEDMKENHKWRKLFVSTGTFFLQNPDTEVQFEQDLLDVFSRENLSRIAEKLKGRSGYELPKMLHSELYDLMARYEVPEKEAETYIHHFMQVILSYLAENVPDKSVQIFLGGLKKEMESHFQLIESNLELLMKQLEDLAKQEIELYTIADIDQKIRRSSRYPGMSLSFFELDDEQFEKNFQQAVKNARKEEIIYVVGKSREETTYRILNELRQKNTDQTTLVVPSKEDWVRLEKSGITGKILIPFFYAGEITVIPENINLFIQGEEEPCYSREKLILRRRTRQNIVDALEKAGVERREAYRMTESTHGLYAALKKKLFKSVMYPKPDWAKTHSDAVMAALLCGKWTKAEGDTLIFQELAGKSYQEAEKELEQYQYGENPFVIMHHGFGENGMQLASVEDAWEELDLYLTEDMWNRFIDLFYEVLIESEPIFEYPFEKHFEASVYAEKPEWSQSLKRGMIRTLIMRAIYRGHEENQRQIDRVVEKVLDTITTKERWGYISQYLTDLCEASPESVLRKLEAELQRPQGMAELFKERNGDYITERHYYTSILWAVEQLLLQKRYVIRAVEWLWKMDAYDLEYQLVNSPKSVLNVVFCPWINQSALSVEKKIALAQKAVQNYPNAWNLILEHLPSGGRSVCSSLNKPNYREVGEPDTLYVWEVEKTYLEYLEICVDTAQADAGRWIGILPQLRAFPEETQKEVLEKMFLNTKDLCDAEKYKVKKELRDQIYEQRYYQKEDCGQEKMDLYENYFEKIKFSDPVYDYLYLFSPEFEFPLLHPVPLHQGETKEVREKNQRLKEEEIRMRIREWKEKKYSVKRWMELAVKQKNSTLGEVMARYYCEGEFQKEIFQMLLEVDSEGSQVFYYIHCLYIKGKVDLKEVLRLVRADAEHKNLCVNLLSLERIENSRQALIAEEDEEIKKMYWSRAVLQRITDTADHDTVVWALDECSKYGTIHTYLELLYDCREKMSLQELYEAVFAIENLGGSGGDSSMTDFYLRELLAILQKNFLMDDEKCAELAGLEWLCRNVLEWEKMKCIQRVMKSDPTFYAKLVQMIYRAEGTEQIDENKAGLAESVYEGFEKAKFCPAEKNGAVCFEELKIWVEKFKKLLEEQRQGYLFGTLLGHLLAHAPAGEDGYMPCEAVRRIIEEYGSDALKEAYVIEEENKRGFHTIDAGKSELHLQEQYRKNAEALQEQSPKTAEIYFSLSEAYRWESERERKRAEDEW